MAAAARKVQLNNVTEHGRTYCARPVANAWTVRSRDTDIVTRYLEDGPRGFVR